MVSIELVPCFFMELENVLLVYKRMTQIKFNVLNRTDFFPSPTS